ncbi:hypothetical protein AFLA_009834 [Aspergillus flavus NRRL3357]|nr:uncharacterized protein G4B84_008849 [Aspergillus flavus NRRL3357]KAF7616337.1 hypothetical protein AFLA_009834 [Aspergillus flavus NRRL3357]QMW33418.1 hypothetical protein G4B84_008849 [Aspergillus flavus NRRL3357]QMW45456.1 hypothetical protein G4B11_008876 [Aspergillus flavus]
MTLSIGNAQLLQAELDETGLSFFQLSIHGRIKYLTIGRNIFSTTEMAFGPSLRSLLPEFPPGDWNDGLIVKDKSTGKPYFARAVRNTFPSVKNQWHEYSVDYSDIKVGKRLQTGIYEAQCPGFDTVVVAKFARFHWEIRYMESETTAYEWIKDHDIGPRFLGHLVEDGRVIGFLMERISNARHAVLDDLEACWDTLSRLHALGIRHGDTSRFNFLMIDSRAVLIDYDTAQKCDDYNVLCEELDGLAESLASTSNRGGGALL